MDITLEENERKLLLWLLGQITIKAVDTEAVSISLAAQSVLGKLQSVEAMETPPEFLECADVLA
jgi:hypothetical protein